MPPEPPLEYEADRRCQLEYAERYHTPDGHGAGECQSEGLVGIPGNAVQVKEAQIHNRETSRCQAADCGMHPPWQGFRQRFEDRAQAEQ